MTKLGSCCSTTTRWISLEEKYQRWSLGTRHKPNQSAIAICGNSCSKTPFISTTLGFHQRHLSEVNQAGQTTMERFVTEVRSWTSFTQLQIGLRSTIKSSRKAEMYPSCRISFLRIVLTVCVKLRLNSKTAGLIAANRWLLVRLFSWATDANVLTTRIARARFSWMIKGSKVAGETS